jgi:cysteine desulfurase
VFTSGGTESDNLALFGITRPGDHVITSAIEHSAVGKSCDRLRQMGRTVTVVPVNGSGQVDPQDVRRALQSNTTLISVMMANNETGVLQAAEEIGRIAAEADVWFHTDAVQAAGKVPIQVDRIRCDLLSISGHKMHAPPGVGALYVRKGALLEPLLHGGRQERGRRAGTENVPGIVALGKAAELALRGLQDGSVEQLRRWRDRFEDAVLKAIGEVGINGREVPRVPNTASIYFEFIDGEALVIALDLKGVAASTGAACSSGAVEPSHVLTAMGLSGERARGSLRFSLGKHNTAADIEQALSILPDAVARLRSLSPWCRKTELVP